jgi:hypothetical protein
MNVQVISASALRLCLPYQHERISETLKREEPKNWNLKTYFPMLGTNQGIYLQGLEAGSFPLRLCGQKNMVLGFCQTGQLFHDAVLGCTN